MLYDLLSEIYRSIVFMFNTNYNRPIYNIGNFLKAATKTQKGYKSLLARNHYKYISSYLLLSQYNAK
ncbi:hypothetical protein ABH942_002304 [Flavobacterium sp. 28YEA47A]